MGLETYLVLFYQEWDKKGMQVRNGIGIKEKGRLKLQPFLKATRLKPRANGLSKKWQREVENPKWYPVKDVSIGDDGKR